MSAVGALAKSDWRSRRRAWLSLALLAGLGAGAVMSAAIGARRTQTAYARFDRAHGGADVVLQPVLIEGFSQLPIDTVRAMPRVLAAGRERGARSEEGVIIVTPEPPLGTSIDRPAVLAGHAPKALGEAAVNFEVARRRHLHIGSRIPAHFMPPGAPDGTTPIDLPLRISAIEAIPGQFPPHLELDQSDVFYVSAATADRAGADFEVTDIDVRLRRGAHDVPAFLADVRQRTADHPQLTVVRAEQAANTLKSFHLQAVALWLVAALLTLVTFAVLVQQLARQAAIDGTANGTLKALGTTRRQLLAAGLIRTGRMSLVAAGVAAIAATALSPLTPLGTARIAETHPGIDVDPTVLLIGVLATVVVFVLAAVWPLWRATAARADTVPQSAEPVTRTSAVSRLAAGIGLPPAAGIGVRMALQRGRGRTAVPVVSSLVSVVIAITALVAALTFGANLNHLLATPRQYGWSWDARVTANTPDANADHIVEAIGADTRIAATAEFASPPITIRGVTVDSASITPVKGEIRPVVLDGRLPVNGEEIALGSDTMRRTHTRVGDTVSGQIPVIAPNPQTFRVVGRVVLPPTTDTSHVGAGALISPAGLTRLAPPGFDLPPPSDLLIRFKPGVDAKRAVVDLSQRLGSDFPVLRPTKPADLVNFGQVQDLPVVLGGLIAVLAALTLAHTLVTSIRRRQRDLSILKALGFSSRQVRLAVAWQATAFAAVAVAIGVPLGTVAGRVTWGEFAIRLGTLPDARVPAFVLLTAVPTAAAVANAIALVPGALAGRLRPASVLQTQ